MTKSRKKGLTILELIITIAIIAITIPAIFGIFFIILQSQKKIFILQKIKKNGDYVLNTMQNVIRSDKIDGGIFSDSALTIEVCSTKYSDSSIGSYGPAELYFKLANSDSYLYFTKNGNQIILNNSGAVTNLTESANIKAVVFETSCQRMNNPDSAPIVTIRLTLANLDSNAQQSEKASLNFQTAIKLRN